MAGSRLDVLERRLEGAFRRYHADAQIRRVAGVFAVSFAWQVRGGFHDWTVKGLWSLLAAAGVATIRQIWKTAPQSLVMTHVRNQQALERQDTSRAAAPGQ